MGIESGIYTILSGSTSLTALVGTRIYPLHVPQNTEFPMLRYIMTGDEVVHSSTSHSNLHTADFEVNCYTRNSYLDVVTLADTVKDILNTQSTSWGTITVRNSHCTSVSDEAPIRPSDGSDDWSFGRSIDLTLHYHST